MFGGDKVIEIVNTSNNIVWINVYKVLKIEMHPSNKHTVIWSNAGAIVYTYMSPSEVANLINNKMAAGQGV